jgi:predicted PurR-regulated permease PerM
MAVKNNEPQDDSANNAKDLDLDDIGVSVGATTIDLDPRSLPIIALSIVVAGILFVLFNSIAQTMTAFVVALLFALALDPLIVKIQYLSFRRLPFQQKVDAQGNPVQRIGRYVAVTIALGAFVTFALIGAYLVAPKVVSEVNGFSEQIPKTVQGLGELPIVGERLGNEQTQENIENFLEQLPAKLSAQDSALGDFARSLFDGAYLGLLFVLMFVTLLLDGPRIVRNFRRLIKPSNRHAADRLALATHRVVGKYMAGSIFVAVLAGLIIGTAGLLLGVPLAPLIGVWIMFTNLIPQIGGFLGGVPFVVLGFTESTMTGLACLFIFLVYQQIENHVIQPIVVGKTVKISPPVTMVAALIGVAAGGVLGAMIAVPAVGAAKALAAEFDFPRGARAKAMKLDALDEENIKRAHLPKAKSKK